MIFSNKFYDIIKGIAMIWLPGLGALYFTLGDIWGVPFATQIVGTITAVDTFLGVILKLSSMRYSPGEDAYDGKLVINTTNPEKDTYNLQLSTDLDDLPGRNSITLQIAKIDRRPAGMSG